MQVHYIKLVKRKNDESMKSMKVSIIVPVYNAEKYLHRCLDSIVNQTYKNIEIILIDDGSADSSGEICDVYKRMDNRIHVIHQTNQGVSVSRNAGLNKAAGEYILFVDADDYIETNMVEVLIHHTDNGKIDVVLFCYDEIKEHGRESVECSKEIVPNVQALRHDVLVDKVTNFLWTKMYKRTVWNGVRFPVGHQYEDLYLLPSVFLHVNTYTLISNVLYHYNRINNTSVTGKDNDFVSRGRYDKFLAYKEHERIARLIKDDSAVLWAESRCIHEGIKALYIDFCSKRKLHTYEKNDIKEYLKLHSSKAITSKYKFLQHLAVSFPPGLLLYGYIRYCQQYIKDR